MFVFLQFWSLASPRSESGSVQFLVEALFLAFRRLLSHCVLRWGGGAGAGWKREREGVREGWREERGGRERKREEKPSPPSLPPLIRAPNPIMRVPPS